MPSGPVAESFTGVWVSTSPPASSVSSTSCGVGDGVGDGVADADEATGVDVLPGVPEPAEAGAEPGPARGVQPAAVMTSAQVTIADATSRRAPTLATSGCYSRPGGGASGRAGRGSGSHPGDPVRSGERMIRG